MILLRYSVFTRQRDFEALILSFATLLIQCISTLCGLELNRGTVKTVLVNSIRFPLKETLKALNDRRTARPDLDEVRF